MRHQLSGPSVASIMAKQQQSISRHPQRIRQSISVPFLWEVKPGTPNRDWKMPDATPLISFPSMSSFPSPARLIISVPFQWEEKPGKPLLSPQWLLEPSPPEDPAWPVYNLPPLLSSTNPFIDFEDDDMIFGCDHDPLQNFPQSLSDESSNQLNSYSASETDTSSNSSSSVAPNGSTGPALDFIFPLSSPDAGFLNELHRQARIAPDASPKKILNGAHGGPGNLPVKRTLTLGELILLSRKLSYRRRATEARKAGLSKRLREFIRKNLFSFFFRASNFSAFSSEPSTVNILHFSTAAKELTVTPLSSEGTMLASAKSS